MRHDANPKAKVLVPVHSSTVKPGTLNNILKTACILVDEVKHLLQEAG